MLRGRGWYVVGHRTVQVIERESPWDGPNFVVMVFFGGRLIDLRYPPIRCRTLAAARRAAIERLHEAGGYGPFRPSQRPPSIEWARCGDVLGLEALA
jgi:hypothetical protein